MKATGEYITLVDGDDWIEKNTFEILIKESDFEDILMYGLQEDYGYKVIDKINQIDPGQYEDVYKRQVKKCSRIWHIVRGLIY